MLKDNPFLAAEREVVIAGGAVKSHRAWPAIETCANGDLLCIYKDGTDHHRTDDAVVMMTRSADGGLTWSAAKPVAAEPGWSCYCNHGMVRLSDGNLLLNVIRGRRVHAGDQTWFRSRSAFTRSTNDGRYWQERGAYVESPLVSPIHHLHAYGRVQELADGRLMAPMFGVPKDPRDNKQRVCVVVFSADGGQTWPDSAMLADDSSGTIGPSETDLLRLADGRLLAMIRGNIALRLYKSFSSDEGHTWSPATDTGLPGQCPALIHLASGAILCAYRDMTPGHPGMSCTVSTDQGRTWTALGHLYVGTNNDCAYPSMVRLPGGRIYCAFYTSAEPDGYLGNCEIHGLILRDRTLS